MGKNGLGKDHCPKHHLQIVGVSQPKTHVTFLCLRCGRHFHFLYWGIWDVLRGVWPFSDYYRT